jgi:hypothetical protein
MAALIAGCTNPIDDLIVLTRSGIENGNGIYISDYNLQNYVPIPSTGQQPVVMIDNRGDLDATVVWKDQAGAVLPSLTVFEANTVYKAEIRLSPKPGYFFNPDMAFAYHPGKISTQIDDLGNPTRTVMITYNNSDDAHITFITDYNLQSYVPIPISGERPVWDVNVRDDLTVEVTWKTANTPNSLMLSSDNVFFELGTVYHADIQLKTKPDYRFLTSYNFDYTGGPQVTPLGSVNDLGERRLKVIYTPTKVPTTINDYNLTSYLAKPIGGTTPVAAFASSQYTGTVNWRNSDTQAVLAGPFQYGTAYTAELILTAASGYTLNGVGQNVFVHTGAETVTNPADSGAVSISFSPSPNAISTTIYDTNLTSRVPKPVGRATPITSFAARQYTGTVTWRNTNTQTVLIGSFQTGTSYTAVISLNAIPGYTFTGLAPNVFSHDGAPGTVTNSADSGVVTINFPPAGPATQAAMSFGPIDAEGSALKIMKDRKNDNNPIIIELPGNATEVVAPNTAAFQLDYNSPYSVTIDGHGRVLKIQDPGIFITVNNGITLTLLNITLEGMSANNAPLVWVRSGGTLILGSGAVLTGNKTTGPVGGVWVNGGELFMNHGAKINKMAAANTISTSDSSGGVMVDEGGTFTMLGGTIGGETLAEGNTAAGNSGGGVRVSYYSSFTMHGGTIQSNHGHGGGVYNGGIFYLYGGSIKGNTSSGYSGSVDAGAGGVYNASGAFIMNGTAAVIEGNSCNTSDALSYGAGGVKNGAPFTLISGTIRDNRTFGNGGPSVGGVLVYNGTSFVMTGGTIEDNTAQGTMASGGVWLGVESVLDMKGGTIKGNDTDSTNYGVYLTTFDNYSSHFNMSGTAQVAHDNVVFLEQNTAITIGSNLTNSTAVKIIHEAPASGRRLLMARSEELITENRIKFQYADAPYSIDVTASPVVDGFGGDTWYYGVIQ